VAQHVSVQGDSERLLPPPSALSQLLLTHNSSYVKFFIFSFDFPERSVLRSTLHSLNLTMSTVENLSSALRAFFTFSSQPKEPALPSISSFPQFSRLPVELRLKIWGLALELRSLRIHLHKSCPQWVDHEQRWEGYAPAWPEHSSLTEPFDGPPFIPVTEEEKGVFYPDTHSGPRPHHMVITPCTDLHPCHCESSPALSWLASPLPASLFACRESREAGIGSYIRCLEHEYDVRGVVVRHPISVRPQKPPSRSPLTGIIMNPQLDSLVLRINVASRSDVQKVQHLASILSSHLPEIRKVVVLLRVAMVPFRHWQLNRFRYWRKWGEDGWWVPVRFLIKLKGLREVVLVYDFGQKMLPPEWRARTVGQWVEELVKVQERWPVEWDGVMPSLRFVGSLAEAC